LSDDDSADARDNSIDAHDNSTDATTTMD